MFLAETVMLFYLLCASVEDIRKKEIRVLYLLILAVFLFIIMYVSGNGPAVSGRLAGTMPGLLLILVSRVSKGGIGMGDAFAVLGLGAAFGLAECLSTLGLAWFICFFAAAGCLILKKRSPIPFLPFLCIGFYVNLWLKYGSIYFSGR